MKKIVAGRTIGSGDSTAIAKANAGTNIARLANIIFAPRRIPFLRSESPPP
jgi:hypothetical protein